MGLSMKCNIFITTLIFSHFILLNASSNPSGPIQTLSSSSVRSPLTAAQLEEVRARQVATITAEPKKVEIGTFDALLSKIHQLFVYQDGLYKGIGLRDFYEKYPHVIESFQQESQYYYALPHDTFNKIYEKLNEEPEKREININKLSSGELIRYKIVGVMPSSEDGGDRLFKIHKVQRDALSYIREYIDNNHAEVHRTCTGLGLATTVSKEVWSPGCCDVQMHRSCFKQSQHNMVTHCINPFCQKMPTNSYCRAAWTSNFYRNVISRQPVVGEQHVRDIACPVCTEPLKPAGGVLVAMINKISDRKRKNSEDKDHSSSSS